MLLQVVFLSNSSPREKELSRLTRVFDKAEQKMSTLHRELSGIVSALQTYEHYIIGSPFPIYLYCDQKPILYLWGRKGQLSHRFFRYQVIITKFQNMKIIWTTGSNLAFPDILSRNVTVEEYHMHNCDTNASRVILNSLTNTVLQSHTEFNIKTTQPIPALTSTQ